MDVREATAERAGKFDWVKIGVDGGHGQSSEVVRRAKAVTFESNL